MNVLTRRARDVWSWVPRPCVGTQRGPGLVHRMDLMDSSKTSLFGLNAWIQTVPEPQPPPGPEPSTGEGRAGEHGPVPAGEGGAGDAVRERAGGGAGGVRRRVHGRGAGAARSLGPAAPPRPRSLRGPAPATGPGQLLCNRRLCSARPGERRARGGGTEGAYWWGCLGCPRPFSPGLSEPRQPKFTECFPLPGRAGDGWGSPHRQRRGARPHRRAGCHPRSLVLAPGGRGRPVGIPDFPCSPRQGSGVGVAPSVRAGRCCSGWGWGR